MLETTASVFWSVFLGGFVEAGSRLFIPYLGLALLIALGVYLAKPGRGSFREFAFPRAAYAHASTATDWKLFFFGRAFAFVEGPLFAASATLAAAFVLSLCGALAGIERLGAEWSVLRVGALTLGLMLLADFCTYWVHRWHHERPALWPFHAVHHSAEVLTPVTVYRKHPVYELISAAFKGLVVGAAQGAVLFAFAGDVDIWLVGGANAAYVAFEALGANLRHTHIWIDFGPAWSRVFISPAQHQIHHSIAPAHRNKNYGEVFALWDWMFGTLYVPAGREALEFGLADEHGARLAQPHPDLKSALALPFIESAQALGAMRRAAMAP